MSALAYPLSVNLERPRLRLVTGHAVNSRAQVYRRRRVVALLVAAALLWGVSVAVGSTVSWLNNQFASPNGVVAPVVQPVANHTVVVRPGDTLWSIASRAHPGTDVRPIVAQMSKARNGTSLQVGDRVTVPR